MIERDASARIRVLIVDDEPLARDRLRELLKDEPDLEILPDCRDGAEAVEAIGRLAPDLVFLDIELPGLDAFEVIRTVGGDRFPAVVFVTGHEKHALRAFEANARDYLLKPVVVERLRSTLERVRTRLERESLESLSNRLEKVVGELRGARPSFARVAVPTGGGYQLVPAAEIDWIEANAKSVRLHTRGRVHEVREMLGRFEARLDPARFVRIHRSAVVNLDRVVRFEATPSGAHYVVLMDGTRLALSRGHRARVYELARVED